MIDPFRFQDAARGLANLKNDVCVIPPCQFLRCLRRVKSHRDLLGAAKVFRLSGGVPPSCFIYVQPNPPLGLVKRDKR
jgi:hypothetical protein